jgi:ATP-dependent exoDNAse (exonuclease V) beta subunit
MLTVYKASAGSGKTFRLVVDFLKLLMKDERNYRHILAVTFTNKATAEMKERVVEQLSFLAAGKETSYKKILSEETGLPEEILAEKSGKVLENILFDYNRFAVSTIDKFTQRVIKAFNREVGITPDFQIELDNELIIDEAVERLISSIDTNKALRLWLEDFIEEKIRNNKNFAVEIDLKNLGKELFKERLQTKLTDLISFFNNPASRKNYLEMLNKNIFAFEKHLVSLATEIVKKYSSLGYSADDFSYKSGGVAGFIEKTAKGTIPEELKVRTLEAAESEEKWIAKKDGKKELMPLVTSNLKPLLSQLVTYYNSHSKLYFTAKAIKKEWFTLAVLLDLNEEITNLNREKSILPLASSNLLLKSIIDGNETPFIYEKTGNTYHHYMLDEFQDTSAMQWENFRPLIGNALSMGASNLAVGDVKQSIYRWRNSDWNILASKIYNDFPGFEIDAVTLDHNYRSDERVVSFNNAFFRAFIKHMAANENLHPVIEQYQPILEALYADVGQKPVKSEKGNGFVKIEFIEDDDIGFKDNSLEKLAGQIKLLQDNGFSAGDIAILVRTNLQGEEIVNYFLETAHLPENEKYNLKVLSNESLFLRTSPAVNFVVGIIRHLINKEDRLTKATLLQLHSHLFSLEENVWYENQNLETEFENRFKSDIIKLEQDVLTSSIDEILIRICEKFGLFNLAPALPFLQALIDKAAEIRKKMTNDLSNFLLWWDEHGQSESVQINEEVDAVRLLTIHKSKGLEFKAVLIPFFNWKIGENRQNIIWSTPLETPFSDAPLVPLSFGPSLGKTIFSSDYYHEYFNIVVDNLNLAYVAFTRARSVLMVNVPQKNTKSNIGYFFEKTLNEMTEQASFEPTWKTGSKVFESGKLPVSEKKEIPEVPRENIRWHFTPFDNRLKLKTGNDDFIEVLKDGKTRKNLGKIAHQILSEIRVAADFDIALEKAAQKGELLPSELEMIKSEINNMLNHPYAKNWFNGNYEIYNEKQLLTPFNIYRPDRIMVRNNEAVVVDFKSGASIKAIYYEQVKRYCLTLIESGITNVTGYLWYLPTNEIEKVKFA